MNEKYCTIVQAGRKVDVDVSTLLLTYVLKRPLFLLDQALHYRIR